MSVFVYRGEEEALIPPERLRAHLESGWSVTKGEKPEAVAEDKTVIPTEEEADTNDSGKLSNAEVRAAAQVAGIDDWKTKRIKALKVELGYS